MTFDAAAVERHLKYLAEQIARLAQELHKCAAGEYSPFMDSDRFEAVVAEALAATGTDRETECWGKRVPHRCSRCEAIAAAWMEMKDK